LALDYNEHSHGGRRIWLVFFKLDLTGNELINFVCVAFAFLGNSPASFGFAVSVALYVN
jgi:hypothetical protein